MSMYKAAAVSRRGYQGGPLSFIGKAISGVSGLIGKGLGRAAPFLPGVAGPIAQIGSKVYGGISSITQPRAGTAVLPPLPGKGFAGGGFGGGGGGGMPGTALACIPNKGWPTNKDGTPRRAKRNGCPWKRPSMNFANGRAIKRAARRLEGAEKMFRRVFSIRHGSGAGKITPKKKGR